MTNEEQILARLEKIEAQLAPISDSARSLGELRDDLTPLINSGIKSLIEGLVEVEADFQSEDLAELAKKSFRSVKYLNFAMTQMVNLVDFLMTVEPLLKVSVPKIIEYLDHLERGGAFETLNALSETMSNPKASATIQKMIRTLNNVDLDGAKPLGPLGLMGALSKPEVKQGLGVVVELTRAMGRS